MMVGVRFKPKKIAGCLVFLACVILLRQKKASQHDNEDRSVQQVDRLEEVLEIKKAENLMAMRQQRYKR